MADVDNLTGLTPVDLSDIKGTSSTGVDTGTYTNPEVIDPPKKRGRPKQEKHVDGPQVRPMRSPLNDASMSYFETYSVPAGMIRDSITELNSIEGRINADLEAVRASRTLKSKYLYISNLTGALTGTIGTKISAIREMRSMIDQANNFELKRQQQLKINEQDSDDKIIADMYNAYLNYNPGNLNMAASNNVAIPASYTNTAHPDAVSIGISPTGAPIMQTADPGFDNYMKNMTPQQNAMLMDSNPFVETVLVYDQSTQNKWFEVIDTRTGAMVPNMEVPNDFVKDGCVVDIRKGIARNASLNQTYKLKLVGFRAEDEF
jgi:hypothetical protein